MALDLENYSDEEADFLLSVLTDIDGVGNKTAKNILDEFNSFSDFDYLTDRSLQSVVDQGKATEIIELFSNYDLTNDIRILRTENFLRSWLDKRYEDVQKICFKDKENNDDLEINPLLVKALAMDEAEDVIDFYLWQRVTRSMVTSWGQSAAEKLSLFAGARGIDDIENVSDTGKRFDVQVTRDGTRYYIQVKSGPNTMNIGMVDSLNSMIQQIERGPGDNVRGMLGMTFGARHQISSQISDHFIDIEERAVIGQEFWALISGEDDYYQKLIALINDVIGDYAQKYDNTVLEAVESKKQDLYEEWEESYGALGEEGLHKFFETYELDE